MNRILTFEKTFTKCLQLQTTKLTFFINPKIISLHFTPSNRHYTHTVNDNFFGKRLENCTVNEIPFTELFLFFISIRILGMGKEVENLIMENTELLATK